MATRPDIIGEEAAQALATLHNDARAPTACVQCEFAACLTDLTGTRGGGFPTLSSQRDTPPPPSGILDPLRPLVAQAKDRTPWAPVPNPPFPTEVAYGIIAEDLNWSGPVILAGTPPFTTPFPIGRVYPRATKTQGF